MEAMGPIVFHGSGCCSKAPPTGWLRQLKSIVSQLVAEARNPSSRLSTGLLRAVKEHHFPISFSLYSFADHLWGALAGGSITQVSASIFM
jgi:hypothetical protein